jgi:hypothetical protein
MGREVSLFSDYHNKENSLTNYCGLILKLLYREHPESFGEAITSLVDDEIDVTIGPVFQQQKKAASSIPDLSIVQRALAIFFETKLDDWFHLDQICRHMEGLSDKAGLRILFLLCNFEADDTKDRFAKEGKLAKECGIVLQPISFERFVGTLESVKCSEVFKGTLEEFKVYLDRNGHLPRWKYLLDVTNCKRSMDEVNAGAYMCPDTGGAYTHRRAKYFGPYAWKSVDTIHEIRALVSVGIDQEDCALRWKNVSQQDASLLAEAVAAVRGSDRRAQENKNTPLQVFLLGPGHETQFMKATSGGMWQSKKYFDIAKDCTNAAKLAEQLKGKTWENFDQ